MLERNALGNFRTLLDEVTLHPMMGRYLTFLGNRKEDQQRTPDENYAREVMQLMTIGLWELNPDGTQRLDGQNQPIPTYTSADIAGLGESLHRHQLVSPHADQQHVFGRQRGSEPVLDADDLLSDTSTRSRRRPSAAA